MTRPLANPTPSLLWFDCRRRITVIRLVSMMISVLFICGQRETVAVSNRPHYNAAQFVASDFRV
jgi:hypothetical protein